MSMVHYISVGFFGDARHEQDRQLSLDECVKLIRQFVAVAPIELQIELEANPHGNARRGVILGSAGGFAIALKDGVLGCPFMAGTYIAGSIGLAAFICATCGCSISDEDGRVMTIQEFIPKVPFGDLFQQIEKLVASTDVP